MKLFVGVKASDCTNQCFHLKVFIIMSVYVPFYVSFSYKSNLNKMEQKKNMF